MVDLSAEIGEFNRYCGPSATCEGVTLRAVPEYGMHILEFIVKAHGQIKTVGHRVPDIDSMVARLTAARECGRGAAIFSNSVRP